MTSRPEQFRVRAIECQIAAQKAEYTEVKEAYWELMRGWRNLADEIEHFEHTWLDGGTTYPIFNPGLKARSG
jgi:hypothetical protein